MHHASDMRWRICAALCGIAVLTWTAVPAGAQIEATEEAPAEGETPAAPATEDELAPATEEASEATEEATPEASVAEPTPEVSLGSPAEADEATEEAIEESAEEASEEAEEEAPAPSGPALTFANSFFTWTHGLTLNSLAPDAQLTHNPTYYQSLGLIPRFYLTNTTFLWANVGLSYELTDSDDTTYNHEPLLTDTLLDLRQNLSWEGFVFQGQVRLGFPTSKASIAGGRVMQTGVGLTVTRPFPELASFTVSINGGYRRWWSTRTTTGTMDPPEYTGPGGCTSETGQAGICTSAGALTNARDIVITGLTLTVMPLAGFTVTFQGIYLGTYGSEIAPIDVPINGGGHHVEDDSLTHWRHFTYFTLAVAYDLTPWMNLALGIQNSGFAAPLYNPDGSVRSPFNPDTQIYLSLTLGLDGIYNEIFGADEEDSLTPEERQRRRQGLASRGSSTSF